MKIRSLILGTIAALGLSCGSSAYAQSSLPGPHTFSQETMESLMEVHMGAWADACLLMKVACRDIVPPRVAYGLLPRLYGAFDLGSRTVLVDIRIFTQEVSYPILVHEMIHFLQDKAMPLRTEITFEQRCAEERQAHDLTLQLTIETNIAKGDERIKPWSVAHAWYGCPAPL